MEDNVRLTMLLDFYGPLLAERQREALSLHLEEDLSYSEVAREMGISRQGAADAAGAAREALGAYEGKLGLLAKHLRMREVVGRAMDRLREIEGAQDVCALLADWVEEDDHGV